MVEDTHFGPTLHIPFITQTQKNPMSFMNQVFIYLFCFLIFSWKLAATLEKIV